MNDTGTMTNLDDSKYEGEWKDGDWNGQGTLTLANSYKYEGEFKNAKKMARAQAGSRQGAVGLKRENLVEPG